MNCIIKTTLKCKSFFFFFTISFIVIQCSFCITRDEHFTSPSLGKPDSPDTNSHHFWSDIFGLFDRTERKQWEKGTRSGKGLEQGLERRSPEALLRPYVDRLKLTYMRTAHLHRLSTSNWVRYRKHKLIYANFLYIQFKMISCVSSLLLLVALMCNSVNL